MTELMTTEQALERAQKLNVITPTGLNLPERMEYIDYYCIATQLTVTQIAIGWGRADLAHRIKCDFPNNYEYRKVWTHIWPKIEWDTLENDARTAPRYSQEERYRWTVEDGLYYGHCQKASHLDPIDYREDVLRMARDLNWNVRQLENYIATGNPSKLGKLPPSRDAPPLRERVGGWLDTLNESDRGYAEYYVNLFVSYLEG
jgi:hypothetical protein